MCYPLVYWVVYPSQRTHMLTSFLQLARSKEWGASNPLIAPAILDTLWTMWWKDWGIMIAKSEVWAAKKWIRRGYLPLCRRQSLHWQLAKQSGHARVYSWFWRLNLYLCDYFDHVAKLCHDLPRCTKFTSNTQSHTHTVDTSSDTPETYWRIEEEESLVSGGRPTGRDSWSQNQTKKPPNWKRKLVAI